MFSVVEEAVRLLRQMSESGSRRLLSFQPVLSIEAFDSGKRVSEENHKHNKSQESRSNNVEDAFIGTNSTQRGHVPRARHASSAV